jgi:DNA-directed RNA polymerase II subunit RPB2
MNSEIIWKLIDTYFEDNPYALVSHHQDSYNQFFKTGLSQIFKEKNPIQILKQQDEATKEFNLDCKLYLGGKDGSKIYYGKPVIYDENYEHYMYPNEARLRNMTYGFSIHFDVDVEFKINADTLIERNITLEKIYLGRFPIMVQSNMCILQNLDPKVRFESGECVNDPGGYFIIDGKEKVIVCQEKFGDNMLYIRDNYSDTYKYSVEVKSASEDSAKPKRTTAVRMVAPLPTQSNGNMVVTIPNVRKPIPLFIVMRALGIVSDKAIIEACLLDMDKNSNYVDLFIPCIHDASIVFTQETALKYIATFTKGKTVPHVLEILSDYFLPHIGEMNFKDKAYFIGHMAFTLLRTSQKEQAPTDRDNFKYKRVEVCGSLLADLFKEYYTIMKHRIYQDFDKKYYYQESQYQGEAFINLIENNYKEIFEKRDVEVGVRKAFKGNWGAEAHTKKPGVVQDLNRLSFNSALAQRRKINLPLDASAKVIGPRLLHSSQWGIIDPLDTPDGGNVGLHKHMSIAAKITTGYSPKPLVELLRSEGHLRFLTECSPKYMASNTKVFVNGAWLGVTPNPIGMTDRFRFLRRLAVIPVYTSCAWNKQTNEIEIYTDEGRLCRPIFYINQDTKQLSLLEKTAFEYVEKGDISWEGLTSGFADKRPADFSTSANKVYSLESLYGDRGRGLKDKQAIIEYMDSSEANVAYISSTLQPSFKNTDYTHMDIHPSLLLGVMGNQIIFPENNQLPRNLFSCGQSKQGASWYHTNYQNRIDKMGVVLNYGQKPAVKSRYMHYINKETQPYGENPIVAIMCYGGYNVEDSILFNEASVKRGMFRTTYINSYEAHEEAKGVGAGAVDSTFTDIQNENVIGTKPGFDYGYLDEHGLIRENTELNDKITIIGKATTDLENPSVKIDASVYPKKGQLGFVDKSFMTEGEEGKRIAKVRIREERIPAVGDKFCSRCGQKGTIGRIIPERDMPFTANGIRPDIIVNPHAFPSRMTIGQLVEVIVAKAGVNYGAFGDCTAFLNLGPKEEVFGRLLTDVGYNKTGNEILYNGLTGEQLEADIFIGPTYYMRLKHMVKDKINYRAQGPRTMLTRQTVQGRANDGGLRVGEMERDGVIAHGASKFLEESMMTRGDEYFMAVCNNTGTIAVYNESKNIFLSPMADGPIKFNGEIDEKLSVVNISKYGRDFSVVRVPYSFKLLMQELLTMNIQMRVITEANVDQLTSMSYSNNLTLLLKDEKITPKNVQEINEKMRSIKAVKVARSPDEPGYGYQPRSPEPDYSEYYKPRSPVEPGYGYLPFEPRSPPFEPRSPPFEPRSPPFEPRSPPFEPRSPPFEPRSPEGSPPRDLSYSPHSPEGLPPRDLSYSPHSPEGLPPRDLSYSPHSPEGSPPPDGSPMFVGDITYKIGDTVNLFKDGFIPNRKWVITAIDERTGNYTLVTDHLAYIPDFAVLSDDGRTATVIANKLELKNIDIEYIPNPGPRELSFSPFSPDSPPPSDLPVDPYNLYNIPVSRREMIPGPRTPSPTPTSPTPPRKAMPKYGAVPPPSYTTTTVQAPAPVAVSPSPEPVPVSPDEDPFAQPYDVRSPSPIEKYLPPATMNRPMVKPPSGDDSPIDKYLPSAGKEINILTDIADEKKEEESSQEGEKDENKKEIKIKLN